MELSYLVVKQNQTQYLDFQGELGAHEKVASFSMERNLLML